MKQPKAIRDWMKCVEEAKRQQRIPLKTYGPVKGTTLKIAQKLYCMMGY